MSVSVSVSLSRSLSLSQSESVYEYEYEYESESESESKCESECEYNSPLHVRTCKISTRCLGHMCVAGKHSQAVMNGVALVLYKI